MTNPTIKRFFPLPTAGRGFEKTFKIQNILIMKLSSVKVLQKKSININPNFFPPIMRTTSKKLAEPINTIVITDMKKRLSDIMMSISWRDFSNTYFKRSSSWFYHKMDGIDGNGGTGGFSEAEKEQMRGALIDLSERIRRAAENI